MIDDFGPAHQIFFNDVFLKANEKVDTNFATNMLETTVFSYLFLTEMSGQTGNETTEKYKSIIDRLCKYKNKLTKKQKDFLKNNFKSISKIKRIRKDKLLSAFFSKEKNQINTLFKKFKKTVREYCEIEDSTQDVLFNVNDMENNRKLLELAALFGVHFAVSKLDAEYDAVALDSEEPKASEPLFRLSMLLRFSGISNILNNHKLLLNQRERYEEARNWRFYANPNAPQEVAKFKSPEAQHEFFKGLFGEKGLAGFFETATQTTQTPEEHLKTLKMLAETPNAEAKDMLRYAEKLVKHNKSKSEAKEWAVKAAEAGAQQGYILAASIASRRNEHEEALGCLLNVTDENLKTASYHYNLGIVYGDLSRILKAKEHLQIAIRQKHMQAYVALARLENNVAKKKVILNLLLSFVTKDDECFIAAHERLANIYSDEKQFDKAREHIQACMDQTPERSAIHLLKMGLSFLEEGIFQEAIPYFEQAFEDGSLSTYVKAQAHYYLGFGYLQNDNKEAALEAFQNSRKKGYHRSLLELAKLYEDQNDIEKAQHFYQKAIAKNVKDARKHYLLFLAKQKKEEAAKEQAEYIQADLFPVNQVTRQDDNDDNDQEELLEYVEVVDTKRYRQMLAEIERELAASQKKPIRVTEKKQDKTHTDIKVTLAHTSLSANLREHQDRIEELLYGLANGHKPGHLEPLTSFSNRWSMRITQGDRLVFDIVEGGIHAPEGVKGIVIVSAKGHYKEKDMNRDEFETHTSINAPWVKAQTDDNDEDSE